MTTPATSNGHTRLAYILGVPWRRTANASGPNWEKSYEAPT